MNTEQSLRRWKIKLEIAEMCFLHKDGKNKIDGAPKQRRNFGNGKKISYSQNQKEKDWILWICNVEGELGEFDTYMTYRRQNWQGTEAR